MTQQRLTMLYLGNDGLLHSWTGIIVTPPPVVPPAIAVPTARIQQSSSSGLAYTFSGTSSSPSTNAKILSYAWSLGDGSTATGATVSHTYAKSGTYAVSLTVTDDTGGSNTTSLTITATQVNIPPTTSLVGQAISADGLTWQYTINPLDSDGTVVRVVVGYGDGGSNDSSLATDPGGIKKVYTHTYAQPGTYTAGTTAYDNAGGVTTVYTTVTVVKIAATNLAPVARFTVSTTGMVASYNASASSDPNGDKLTYNVDWGDGSAHATQVTDSHTYTAVGPWTVTLVVTDPGGLTSTTTASVAPSPLARDPRYQPFSSHSYINTPIGSGATYASDSDPTTASVKSGSAVVNHSNWSVSVIMAQSTDPSCSVSVSDSGFSLRNPVKIPNGAPIVGGSDNWTSVIQPDGRYTQEMSGGTRQTGPTSWACGHATWVDLYGDSSEINGGQTKASKTSDLAGLIRQFDINQGVIKHALQMTLSDGQLKSGYVWPSLSQDGSGSSTYSGTIPMGSLFAIPPSVDVTTLGLSATGLILARALQDYGVYVLARSSTVALDLELAATSTVGSALSSAWTAVRPLIRMVTNNSKTNVGGGGTPRQPLLPELV